MYCLFSTTRMIESVVDEKHIGLMAHLGQEKWKNDSKWVGGLVFTHQRSLSKTMTAQLHLKWGKRWHHKIHVLENCESDMMTNLIFTWPYLRVMTKTMRKILTWDQLPSSLHSLSTSLPLPDIAWWWWWWWCWWWSWRWWWWWPIPKNWYLGFMNLLGYGLVALTLCPPWTKATSMSGEENPFKANVGRKLGWKKLIGRHQQWLSGEKPKESESHCFVQDRWW